MPRPETVTFRASDTEQAQLDDLGRRWGPVEPLSRSAVIREAVRRAWETETAAPTTAADRTRNRSKKGS